MGGPKIIVSIVDASGNKLKDEPHTFKLPLNSEQLIKTFKDKGYGVADLLDADGNEVALDTVMQAGKYTYRVTGRGSGAGGGSSGGGGGPAGRTQAYKFTFKVQAKGEAGDQDGQPKKAAKSQTRMFKDIPPYDKLISAAEDEFIYLQKEAFQLHWEDVTLDASNWPEPVASQALEGGNDVTITVVTTRRAFSSISKDEGLKLLHVPAMQETDDLFSAPALKEEAVLPAGITKKTGMKTVQELRT